jgi:cytochrome P450
MSGTVLVWVCADCVSERREKLIDEVRSTFESESEINLIGANKLTYMLACLDEAMRMYPPVPGSFPRDVPPGGDRVGDLFIPEGVSATAYS